MALVYTEQTGACPYIVQEPSGCPLRRQLQPLHDGVMSALMRRVERVVHKVLARHPFSSAFYEDDQQSHKPLPGMQMF